MSRKIMVFDTTLRDGEQSPGCSMNTEEKVALARQLERLNVDVIEAGFPIASIGDFEAVKAVALALEKPIIAGLCRANEKDIHRCYEAVSHARRGRIHTFLATSDIHLQAKLKMSREDALERAVSAVKYARSLIDDVEFSLEDAGRTDWDYMCRVVEAVIDAGARTINLPDTVGYTIPSEFHEMITYVMNRVPNMDKAIISLHCHNDLGLAVANSLAGILAGAGQVECTINGIGERAGNAAMEEIVMALKTRANYFGAHTDIVTEEIYRSSKLLSSIIGVEVQPNKAIVGKNAFAHEAGIHQHGMLSDKRTYEIMTPESIGLSKTELVLGKHSGRHAFKARLEELGYSLNPESLETAFEKFKALADRKKEIFDEDLEHIANEGLKQVTETFILDYVGTTAGSSIIPTSCVRICTRENGEERLITETAIGDGPVEASYHAINKATGYQGKLLEYQVKAVSKGEDAVGDVTVKIEFTGLDRPITGKGSSTDVLHGSALAYVDAVNKARIRFELQKRETRQESISEKI
ncbi:2-isopropylmalate synthase [Desulfurispirillum indicum]|uniref:2-isopropylmalate synthase n=1 Tax=Desulfurispirillum indicum (strain ATCC BAA-1389 / DSM 22839 / S5) TaxID=653733 RepID=E6W6Q1_DESIS|nr:2-isopropylmalate synthase [Desulfurispirillum indicum]ADU65051.1 2-isopropylmalate synthase [Desulfurispirillum indicum S5]UCZ56959.1 2-isopropylmalate synthase [Desulfurispirillum indicum]